MKNFIILLVMLIVNFSTFAQDPQLFENDWYLQKVIIDGEDFYPPNNDEVDVVTLSIQEVEYYSTNVCNAISGEFITITNDTIFVEFFYMLLGQGDCNLGETYDFENIYFNLFYNWQEADNLFDYEIETISGNYKILILINLNGDTAIYGNELLSNQDFKKIAISLYPNPVKNTLQISAENSIVIKNIQVFDVLGKQLLQTNVVSQIDFSALAAGLLFVKVATDKGVVIKKVIKE